MINDVICPAPWDHHCVNTNGKNRLCCNAVTSETKFLDGFDSYWTGAEVTLVREQMLSGIKPAACKSCWSKEESGIQSLRQTFIENYKIRNEWEAFCERLHRVSEYPIEIDLKLGNYCNLSCRMCNSYSSSSYASEFKAIFKDTKIDYGIDKYEKSFVQRKWYNDPDFENTIKKIIDNGLRQLKMTGGEPLMVPSVKKLLTYCIEQGRASNIDLVLITNGTLITDEWIRILNQFKHVSFILSIDGVENLFEYIRHPGKWNRIMEVFGILANTTFYKSIAFTLQVYNVLDIPNLIKISRKYNFDLGLIPLDAPDYLDVQNIPTNLRDDALTELTIIEPINDNERIFLSSAISKISNSSYNEAISKEFFNITRLKDQYKKQDIETLDIWRYYEMFCDH